MHLDLVPDGSDQAAEVARLVSLGATQVSDGPAGSGRMVMTDPDGNGFCVLPRITGSAGSPAR